MLKIGVLGSTRGTALQGVIDAIHANTLDAKIELIVSNKSDAGILERAKTHEIKSIFVSSKGLSREQYDDALSNLFKEYQVDLILLVGYMRILSTTFINDWRGKILNVHPSLLPAFAGLMDLDVHKAALDSGATETGCTIHQVSEIVDGGEIVLQKRCAVEPNDTADSLKQKVQLLENTAFVEALRQFM